MPKRGAPSVLFCYAFGKAQRLLNGIDSVVGPIICHGAVNELNRIYRESGVWLPPTEYGTDEDDNVAMNEAVAFKESHA